MKRAANLYSQVWLTLRHPLTACQKVSSAGMRETTLYALALLSVPTVLFAIGAVIIYPRFMAPYLGGYASIGWWSIPLLVITLLAGGFVSLLVVGIVLHIAVRVLGGKGSLRDSLRAAVHCATPLVLSLWFPPFVIITGAWSAILAVVWVEKIHGLSMGKAVASVVLPPLIVLVLVFGIRDLS